MPTHRVDDEVPLVFDFSAARSALRILRAEWRFLRPTRRRWQSQAQNGERIAVDPRVF